MISNSKVTEKKAKPSDADVDLARKILSIKGIYSTDEKKDKVLSYFVRYGYLPLYESNSIQEATNSIVGAPWMGIETNSVQAIIKELVSKGVLEFTTMVDVGNIPVLRLAEKFETGDDKIDTLLTNKRREILQEIDARSDICKIIGWTLSKDNLNELNETFDDLQDGATLKIMAYHGVTWFSNELGIIEKIINIANEKKSSKFEILIVDEKAKGKVIEGATREEHRIASFKGLQLLKKIDISPKIDIRTYGLNDSDALMRCTIVESKDKLILKCYVTTWFYGSERGIYGKQLWFDGNSNMAILCRDYFDSVFKKGWPKLGLLRKTKWLFKSKKREIIYIVLVTIIATVSLVLAPRSIKLAPEVLTWFSLIMSIYATLLSSYIFSNRE